MQPNNRSILGFLSRNWGNESAPDRALWDAWAAAHPVPDGFGGTFQLDGNQAYIKLNHTAIRLYGGAGKNAQPPVSDLPAVCDSLVVTSLVVGEAVPTWTILGVGAAGDKVEVWIAGPFTSPGRRAVSARFTYVTKENGNVLTSFVANLQSGAYYWLKVRYTGADGQTSNWVLDQILIA
jgi:hypothetical protein